MAACQLCTCPCHVNGDMGVDVHAHMSWEVYQQSPLCEQAENKLKESLVKTEEDK